jgi:hypothetical protein
VPTNDAFQLVILEEAVCQLLAKDIGATSLNVVDLLFIQIAVGLEGGIRPHKITK